MRTDLGSARFNWTHRFSQLVFNSDLSTDVNLEVTRMMTPHPLLPIWKFIKAILTGLSVCRKSLRGFFFV